jgi:hypothetical protein
MMGALHSAIDDRLTMWPDARRNVARLLVEIDAS